MSSTPQPVRRPATRVLSAALLPCVAALAFATVNAAGGVAALITDKVRVSAGDATPLDFNNDLRTLAVRLAIGVLWIAATGVTAILLMRGRSSGRLGGYLINGAVLAGLLAFAGLFGPQNLPRELLGYFGARQAWWLILVVVWAVLTLTCLVATLVLLSGHTVRAHVRRRSDVVDRAG